MPVYSKGRGRWLVVIYNRGVRQDRIIRGTKAEAEAFEAHERVRVHGRAVGMRGVASCSGRS